MLAPGTKSPFESVRPGEMDRFVLGEVGAERMARGGVEGALREPSLAKLAERRSIF